MKNYTLFLAFMLAGSVSAFAQDDNGTSGSKGVSSKPQLVTADGKLLASPGTEASAKFAQSLAVKLNLSAAQQAQVQTLAAGVDIERLTKKGQLTPQAQQFMRELNAILGPEQKASLEKLYPAGKTPQQY